MLEKQGNIWNEGFLDAICVTTNGFVKTNGNLVMGRGIAKQASDKFASLPRRAGMLVRLKGNRTQVVSIEEEIPYSLVLFPVKHNWWEKADMDLIEKSTKRLVHITNMYGWKQVGLPRPGCGNGGLDWSDVKLLIERFLDNRFIAYYE